MLLSGKKCLQVAKVDLAGLGVTSAKCDKSFFGWEGKGVERSREDPVPFPPLS